MASALLVLFSIPMSAAGAETAADPPPADAAAAELEAEAAAAVPEIELDVPSLDSLSTPALPASDASATEETPAAEPQIGIEEGTGPDEIDAETRLFPSAATAPDGEQIVLYGGANAGDPGVIPAYEDTWVWANGVWRPVCGTAEPGADGECGPGPRALHSMATSSIGVLLYGGAETAFGEGSPADPHGDMWVWDGVNWNLVCGEGACPPGIRFGSSMAGNLVTTLLFGGGTDTVAGGLAEDTWAFDGAAWTQVCGAGLGKPCGPVPRVGAAMSWDGTQFVLFGGLRPAMQEGEQDIVYDGAWVWNGEVWVQVCGEGLPACGPEGRMLGTMAYLANPDPALEGAILTGGLLPGEQQGVMFADLWFWDGAAFRELPTPWPGRFQFDSGQEPAPGALFFPLVVSRWSNCQVVLIGTSLGSGGAVMGTATDIVGWDLDGNTLPDGCPEPEVAETTLQAGVVALPFTGGHGFVPGLLIPGLALVLAGCLVTRAGSRAGRGPATPLGRLRDPGARARRPRRVLASRG